MGRWAWFFFFLFVICTFLASIADGGGGLATTQLTSSINPTDTTLSVVSTADFLGADATHPAYVVVDDEIMTYTGITAVSFTGVTRGVADPTCTNVQNPAVAHSSLTTVRTIAVSAMDSFMGLNVTTSNATFGVYQAFTFGARMFTHIPKFITWNYNFLNSGQIVMLKYFVLYPISAGFVFALAFGFIILGMGLFKL